MKIESIKPIPKYILNLIKRKDKNYSGNKGNTRYYSYLTKIDGELCKITVAVKYHNEKFYYKQCAIHGVKSEKGLVKDMVFTPIAGYHTGFYAEGISKTKKWYEDGKWYYCDFDWFNVYSILVNKDYLKKCEEYKYAACDLFTGDCIIKYLKQYEQHPEIELLMKAGLEKLIYSKQIINKLNKDKAFKKWLYQHKEEITYDTYITSVLKAYNKNLTIRYVDIYDKSIKNLKRFSRLPALATDNKEKLSKYIAKNNTNIDTYNDYIQACNYLHIDLTDTKNVFPTDFQRWHNIRIDQYATKKAEEDAILQKELYEKFGNIANKYASLQLTENQNYICIIAKSPAELIKEGEILHHCVGRMNYDQKFVKEQTLIFFIRNKNDSETPLVTIEFSLSERKILQCYAEHDHKPNDNIQKFAYEKWLPFAKKQLEKIYA